MGDVYHITCGQCSHRYEVYTGAGMRCSALFCEACGKQVTLPYSEDIFDTTKPPRPDPPCACGGKLSSAIHPACPKCGSRLMRSLEPDARWD
jgi:hypothetical protein